MTFDSWESAVAEIRTRISACDDEQKAFAASLGVEISNAVPRTVAAARLQSAVERRCGLCPKKSGEIRLGHLAELAEEASHEFPNPTSAAETQAWIEYFYLKRRMEALARLRLRKGDVIRTTSPSNQINTISSIGNDGIVYFTGGGARSWPDRLTVVARINESTPESERARRIAANQASARSTTGRWSVEKQESLRDFRISENASHEDYVNLRDVVESAVDERPIQDLLQRSPQLLGSLLRGPRRYCIPKPNLGGTFVPDFLLAEVDSNGVHWILVELETPNSSIRMSTVNDFEVHARRGVGQIYEWRQWLQDNIAYARQYRENSGLGLHDIRADPKGMVLVGRRSLLHPQERHLRRQLYERSQIEMHTYDWLLEQLEGALQFEGPWALNPYALKFDEH